ncbi:bifunctional diguanylate cyclase/phosphodiesterase [Novosphingobium aquimarinum]|uniref:bifunctional diguanylate cyclase/phosphodiesterase n=1 Tax=Novosphingobium aquimarinum TaxID=2682494 RepID=UPI0012EB68CB|nr:EAL domain-containing protein [Novosphingobium aquimarinum]
MFDLLFCLENEHDMRLVWIAVALCTLTAAAVVLILQRAIHAKEERRRNWFAAAVVVAGLGVWATHFVAMLGYDPGAAVSYNAAKTLISLAIAVATATGGFLIAEGAILPARRVMAAVVVGAGAALMHYVGMMAVEMPAIFRWSPEWIAVSLAFAIVPMVVTLELGVQRNSRLACASSGLAFVIAILGLHFSGVVAATAIPSRRPFTADLIIDRVQLGSMVALVALMILVCVIVTAVTSLRIQAAAAVREREFRIFVQGITDYAIYMLTPDGRVASWNAGAAKLKGYSEAEAIGLPLETFYAPAHSESGNAMNGLARAREEGRFAVEGWCRRKDGSSFWAHVTIEPVHDERGRFRGFAKITRDMTVPKQDKDRLIEASANLDAALSNMHQGLCLFGEDRRLILWNQRFCELYGIEPGALREGMTIDEFIRASLSGLNDAMVSDERVALGIDRLLECLADDTGGSVSVEYANGMHVFMAHRRLEGGGWVSTFEDVTARRLSEAKIAHMALHDDLTGLPNRIHFGRRLDEAMVQAASEGGKIGIAVVDLDRFKEINDTWGHAAGDTLLCAIAEKLHAETPANGFFARLGGDEFAAFFPYTNDDELQSWVARIERAFTQKIILESSKFSAGGSIGIASYPTDGENREQVLNNADLAMYRAKGLIGASICYYERGMDEKARAKRQLANDLRHAIERNELSLAFQDQCSLVTDEVTGYEALLRWNHTLHGPIPPSRFIPIAEESGAILEIGAWVLREACRQAVEWDKPLKVAVNLSAVQLMQVDLIETVITILTETGLSPRRLELEITESVIIADKARALHILRSLKSLGVTIAIDDFGTGYSSLDTLNSFPFDKIKIDKSFLLESSTSPQARAIIRAVLALGRSLNVPVLAEGLESVEQLELLKLEGCDEAQGYFFGRPRPSAQLGQTGDHGHDGSVDTEEAA